MADKTLMMHLMCIALLSLMAAAQDSIPVSPNPYPCANWEKALVPASGSAHQPVVRTVELVVAHCKNPLKWLAGSEAEVSASNLHLVRVTVYTKCGVPVTVHKIPGTEVNLIKIPNKGRNDQAYAHHLAVNHGRLADAVLFVKDSHFDYPLEELRKMSRNVTELIAGVRETKFSCGRIPMPDTSIWHFRAELLRFRVPSYNSAEQLAQMRAMNKSNAIAFDSNSEFRGKTTPSMCAFLGMALTRNEMERLSEHRLVPVCYGGSFASTRELITKVSAQSWRRFSHIMSRGDNIEEGHFMERLWGPLIGPLGNPTFEDDLLLAAQSKERNPISPYSRMGQSLARSYIGLMGACTPLSAQVLTRERRKRAPHTYPVGWNHYSATGLKIVLCSHAWDMDGAPMYLFLLAKHLVQQGHDVIAISPIPGALQAEYEKIGVLALEIPLGWDVTAADLVDKLLALSVSPPDLFIFNTVLWTRAAALGQRLCPGQPRVMWILHEWEIVAHTAQRGGNWWGAHFPWLQPHNMRFTASAPDAVVFVADAQRDLWGEWDYGNFHTVPGFPPQKECPKDKPFVSRAALGIPESAFVMSMAGTFCYRKQQLWGIAAANELLQNGADVYLLLLGSPSEAGGRGDEEYAGLVRNATSAPPLSERVKLIPFQFCNTNYLSIVDLHLSASTHEAYPLNTLEAMERAVPVVATAAGGSAEQFIDPRTHWMVVQDMENGGEFIRAVLQAHSFFAEGKLATYGRILKETTADKAPAKFTKGFQKIMTLILRDTSRKSMCKMWTPEACYERPGEPPEELGIPPVWTRGYDGHTWYSGYLSKQYSPPLISSVNLPDPIPFPTIGLPDDPASLLDSQGSSVEGEASLRLLSDKARLAVSSQPAVFSNSRDFPSYMSTADTAEPDVALLYAANVVLVNKSDPAKHDATWATNASRAVMYGARSKTLFTGVRVSRIPLTREGFDLQPNGQLEVAIADVVLMQVQSQMLREVGKSNTGRIAVHGKFTVGVLQRHGIMGVITTGCPSLMLNPRTDLGKVLAAKFEHLGAYPLIRESCRIGVMLPRYWAPKLIRSLLTMLQMCSVGIILTRKRDFEVLEEVQKHVRGTANRKFPEVFHLDDLEGSSLKLKQLDLVISAQAIGGTLALISETPAIVISTDWATKELADTMHLISTDIFDPLLGTAEQHPQLIQTLARGFNGLAFDANRQELASRYTAAFKATGAVPSVNIRTLAMAPVPSSSEEGLLEHPRSPTLGRPLFHFALEHSGNQVITNMLSKLAAHDPHPQRFIVRGHTDVPDWVLMRGSIDNAEIVQWRDRLACATIFSGGFDALYIAYLLVKVDRGDFGTPRCRRWNVENNDTKQAQALKIVVHNVMCAGIIRDPSTFAYVYWNHYLATSAHGVCTNQEEQTGCSKLSITGAIDQLGAAEVVRKCRGNVLVTRFGSSPVYGDDDDSSSRFRRAKRIITGCSRGGALKTEAHAANLLKSLGKVLGISDSKQSTKAAAKLLVQIRFAEKKRFTSDALTVIKKELQIDGELYFILNRTNGQPELAFL